MHMTKAKLLPFINKFNGDVKVVSRKEGKTLNEDWARAKVVKNDKCEDVFRFELSSPVKGPDGKTHMATAIVDLQEIEQPIELEALDGERNPE